MGLRLVPISQREAKKWIDLYHRHHRAPHGAKFCIAVEDSGRRCGVVFVGRPVSRHLDDGETAEVTRLCTDGTKNACSMLYGAAWRAARAMGYVRIITYILGTENGASLRASGWKLDASDVGGGKWSRQMRLRLDDHPTEKKSRWLKGRPFRNQLPNRMTGIAPSIECSTLTGTPSGSQSPKISS